MSRPTGRQILPTTRDRICWTPPPWRCGLRIRCWAGSWIGVIALIVPRRRHPRRHPAGWPELIASSDRSRSATVSQTPRRDIGRAPLAPARDRCRRRHAPYARAVAALHHRHRLAAWPAWGFWWGRRPQTFAALWHDRASGTRLVLDSEAGVMSDRDRVRSAADGLPWHAFRSKRGTDAGVQQPSRLVRPACTIMSHDRHEEMTETKRARPTPVLRL